jgi:hypothetical protein
VRRIYGATEVTSTVAYGLPSSRHRDRFVAIHARARDHHYCECQPDADLGALLVVHITFDHDASYQR